MAYPKIEGERPDLATHRVSDKGDNVSVPGTEEFKALLSRSADGATADGSMHTMLVEFITPIIKDPGIFQENRIITMLEHLRDQILPMFKENPELTQLATRVINDEVARFTDLRERRQAGIAA